jgi:hypothetical protein
MNSILIGLAALTWQHKSQQILVPSTAFQTQGVEGQSFVGFGEQELPIGDCEKVVNALVWAYSEPFERAGHYMDRNVFCMGLGSDRSLVAYNFSTEPLIESDIEEFEKLITDSNARVVFPSLKFQFKRVESMSTQRSFVVTADLSAKSKVIYRHEFKTPVNNFLNYFGRLTRENRIFRQSDFAVVDYYLRQSLGPESYDEVALLPLSRYVFTSWHQHVLKLEGRDSELGSNIATGNFRDCRDASTPCELQ